MHGFEHIPPATPEKARGPWYGEMTRYHWFVLAVAAMGWLFDTMDQQLFVLARPAAMVDLVPAVSSSDPNANNCARQEPAAGRRLRDVDLHCRLGRGRPVFRHAGGPHRPRENDDDHGPDLLAVHGTELLVARRLGFCFLPLSHGAGSRWRVCRRRGARGRSHAQHGAASSAGAPAGSLRHRKCECRLHLSRFGDCPGARVAATSYGALRVWFALADHVPDRGRPRLPGPAHHAPAQRTGTLGTGQPRRSGDRPTRLVSRIVSSAPVAKACLVGAAFGVCGRHRAVVGRVFHL